MKATERKRGKVKLNFLEKVFARDGFLICANFVQQQQRRRRQKRAWQQSKSRGREKTKVRQKASKLGHSFHNTT